MLPRAHPAVDTDLTMIYEENGLFVQANSLRDKIMEDTYEPCAQVESLHGPGTIRAWLLTVISILISWTFNTQSRRRDAIPLDLIVVLLLLIVAAGHSFYQVAHLPLSVV